MNKILVYSRENFKNFLDKFRERLDVAIISIECTGECRKYYMKEVKNIQDNEHLLPSSYRVLNLDFDDLTQDKEWKGHLFKAISEDQAKDIIDFVERNIGKDIVIHCGAGKSRSQGVFRAILDLYSEYYQESPENKENPCLTPNIEVVAKIKRAYRERKQHFWFDFQNNVNRLLKTWDKKKNLVVGFDFDGTIFDTNNVGGDFSRVISLLKECSEVGMIMCLWTAELSEERLKEKIKISEELGIKVSFVNESPLMPGTTKPYFNILLDDRAGLPYTYKVLKETLRIIKTL